MEQVTPDVMPEEMWAALRNMGDAIEKFKDWPLPGKEGLNTLLILVLCRWMDLVETLEAWTGPNDVKGGDRWLDDGTEAVDDV